MKHHRAKEHHLTVAEARALRRLRGMSFRQIAAKLGVSMWTIRDWCEYRTRVNG